jgi:hypothetical protein
MFKTASLLEPPRRRPGFEFGVLIIGICFGFRISNLEFVLFIIHHSAFIIQKESPSQRRGLCNSIQRMLA